MQRFWLLKFAMKYVGHLELKTLAYVAKNKLLNGVYWSFLVKFGRRITNTL